ncbi:hypothetical protein BH11MYX1_BH11MYX1_14780 [soil metagenome]
MKRVVLAVYLACMPCLASADPPTTPIRVGQSYSIDLYDGAPLGNAAVIGTGGAAIADSIGSSGTLLNASASAVRPTTDTDSWSWDYHLDFLIGSLSSDYANSGLTHPTGSDPNNNTLTGGLAFRRHNWAVAFTAVVHTATIDATDVSGLRAQTTQFKFALAKWFPELDMAIGLSVDSDGFSVRDGLDQPLFSIQGAGGEAGAQWIPRHQRFRIGANVVSAITGSQVDIDNCPIAIYTCTILPDHVVSPARFGAGIAYRFAETEWNQTVGGVFRDERSLTALADLVITGPSANGYGLDAFGVQELERSGRHTSFSIRGGVEYEWLPGRLRVRAGSYWEPNRFEGVPGRLHGTLGIELRALEFQLWGLRRGRITLTADLASGYNNLGGSLGFWH